MTVFARFAISRWAGLCIFVLLSQPALPAGFTAAPGGDDQVASFNKTYNYFFGAGGANPIGPEGINWSRSLRDAGPGHDLSGSIQHLPNGQVFPFSFPGIAQGANPQFLGYAAQAVHNDGKDVVHATAYIRALNGGAPEGFVNLRGIHTTPFLPFGWSLHNPAGAGGAALTGVTVTPSYRDGSTVFNGPPEAKPDVAPGGSGRGTLPGTAVNPATGRTGHLSDYTVRATGSPASETALAFLGYVDGVLSELDLDSAASLFAGDDEFLVPVFSHTGSDDPLYAAVDLVQWLTALDLGIVSTPSFLDTFAVSGGTSAALPGFEFATRPFEFVSGTGWVGSGDPYNGDVYVRAYIDGQTIPEPAGLELTGSALALLALGVRRASLPR